MEAYLQRRLDTHQTFFELQNWIREVLKNQHTWQLPKTSIFEDSAFQNSVRMAFVMSLRCVSDEPKLKMEETKECVLRAARALLLGSP